MMELVMKHVSKTLNGRKVLDDIDIRFEGGRVYGLQGYNGSGKTMLLRMACGLIRPTQGQVDIDGQELGRQLNYPPSVGLLIENPAFLDEFTGAQNLEMILSLRGKCSREQVLALLRQVGLEEGAGLKYKKYSLGMKQRLGIAAAIMEAPELLLLDEPTNALDGRGIEMVTALIRGLRDAHRLILIASHEKGFLQEVTDVVYEMDNGQIRQAGV